jgi:2-polyprenyl-3-methyl-5-hydroxy-6-metoxy-1,4-benzoquinol methylase
LISEIQRTEPVKAEFSQINDAAYQRSIGQVRQQQASVILKLVQQLRASRGDWLDVGCSFGYLLMAAQQVGFQVFGVEPDAKAVQVARARLGSDLVQQGVMTPATRLDRRADVVSTLDVLEHVPVDTLAAFAQMIQQTLKPEGLWVIKVPSTEGLYFTVAHRVPFSSLFLSGVLKRLWQSEYEYPHTVYFNQKTLRQFLENQGYEVLAVHYLAEIPSQTIVDRLLMDSTIPRWQAFLSVPIFYLMNWIEAARGKSDALLMIAQRTASPSKISR